MSILNYQSRHLNDKITFKPKKDENDGKLEMLNKKLFNLDFYKHVKLYNRFQ